MCNDRRIDPDHLCDHDLTRGLDAGHAGSAIERDPGAPASADGPAPGAHGGHHQRTCQVCPRDTRTRSDPVPGAVGPSLEACPAAARHILGEEGRWVAGAHCSADLADDTGIHDSRDLADTVCFGQDRRPDKGLLMARNGIGGQP